MTKKLEQLTLQDLKLAFNSHLDRMLEPKDKKIRNEHWRHFWNQLKDKCSVIETE